MTEPEFPTPWQRKTLWVAIASLSVVIIGAIAIGLIWLTSRVLGFLQPILIPFAVAAVMAYLLDPVVSWIVAWGSRQKVARIITWGTTRQRAVMLVFAVVSLALGGILIWIVPAITKQTENLVHRVPRYTQQVKRLAVKFAQTMEQRSHMRLFPQIAPAPTPAPEDAAKDKPEAPAPAKDASAAPAPAEAIKDKPDVPPAAESPVAADTTKDATEKPPVEPEVAPVPAPVVPVKSGAATKPADLQYDWDQLMSGEWVRTALPVVLRKTWDFVTDSVGGFLGIFGFLLSMIIVPVYLYYFLIESRQIAESWGDYLPLRASAFKDEVVSALEEINGYLIAFFRGQLLVSLINGTITGLGLGIVGLDFGLLIGLLLCVLNLIPYLGIMICWVPAVIIASVQGGVGTWIPGDPWWVFPLVITAIFIVVQQVDGLFVTPKIVGESVGLHPMTVIVSVFVWSLLMGGLLGAILAVPMTATLKVLLKRYVWERRFKDTPIAPQSFAERLALEPETQPVHAEMSTPVPPPPRVVTPDTTLRDTLFAVVCGILVLGFVIYGVMSMGAKQQPASANTLSGKVVAKHFIPAPEEEISVGSKGVRAQKTAGEYSLSVRVESTQRTYDVPVDARTYGAAKIGDTQTFLRPPSEQQK